MTTDIKFNRRGDVIVAAGIDLGPLVRVVAEKGNRALWKASGHHVWSGNGQPWRWYGSVYMAVEISGDVAVRVREEQPGVAWRAVERDLRRWVEEQGDATGATQTPAP